MTKDKKEPNLKDMKDSLGMIISSYTYIADNLGYLKETDVVMRFVIAMLDAQGKLDIVLDKKGNTYRKIFKNLRKKWAYSIHLWNANSGEWRDSWVACAEVLDVVIRIAVKEELLSVKSEQFNLTLSGQPGMARLPMMEQPPEGSELM